LHRRVAEALCDQFAKGGAAEPELIAHHFTQAGLTEAAVEWWGKAGQRSLERSALAEAIEQLKRALDLIATLLGTPALRREQIRLQVALIAPLLHVKGYAATEAKGAVDRAHFLIQQAEALGESPDDPLLLFVVLHGYWVANIVEFNGDVVCQLATHFLALAEKQRATAPLLLGHRVMGPSLLCTGEFSQGKAHLDRAIALYDPAEHRVLATRFGEDQRVAILCWRSHALWALGYPEDALADANHALKDAREIGQAATLMFALCFTSFIHFLCGNSAEVSLQADELASLADETGALLWKAAGMTSKGSLLTLTGKYADSVVVFSSGIAAMRSTGTTQWMPSTLSSLASAYAELGQFAEAWRCSTEALDTIAKTKETRWEAEANRIAGEITLKSPMRDETKALSYFERALSVARQQQAKSWELRAAMSMARLGRDQGKRDEARDLLAPVYGWFTEGFDTLDLKEARALLDELVA
jgi:predicted ATPase